MSKQEQEQILDMLVGFGIDEDEALNTVIDMTEDDEQEQLQESLLLELNECY